MQLTDHVRCSGGEAHVQLSLLSQDAPLHHTGSDGSATVVWHAGYSNGGKRDATNVHVLFKVKFVYKYYSVQQRALYRFPNKIFFLADF